MSTGTRPLPRHIAVEGPIGVGKTSLCRRLAASFNHELLLEQAAENPFLNRFYEQPRQFALSTQLFFLLQRTRQMQDLRQQDIFNPLRVADFMLEKDRLFAELTLDADEFALYAQVYDHLAPDTPVPDLVIYLQAPVDTLLDRIQRRGIAAEQRIERSYLERLSQAYTTFFHFYDRSPLLIVNCTHLDLVGNEDDYQQLLDYILAFPGGTQYFNPKPALL